MLPKTWKTSADRAVTVAGDGSGLHLLAAEEPYGLLVALRGHPSPSPAWPPTCGSGTPV
ncbi:hypothetical protein ACRAWF_39960 [Streptomyces sp. L7]